MFRRILASLVVLACLTTLLALNPHDVISRGDKARPAELDMSPMGRIAAGFDPVPEIAPEPDVPFFTAPSPVLSGGGADALTHSPVASDFQSETAIAKNGDWIVVGFNDVRGFAFADPRVSGYAYSHDGGLTWTDGGQLPTAGLGDDVFGDPDVKTWTDDNGTPIPGDDTIYFAYSSIYLTSAGIQSMCVHVSTDGGVTWAGPREVTPATIAGSSADKEFIDFDPETGRLFISWTNFPSAGTRTIKTAYSDDFGVSWSAATSFTSSSGQGSVPRAAGDSDNVYIVWTTGGTMQFVRSTNNGVSWGTPASIATGLSTPMNPYGSDRIHNMPSMDVDPNNGNVYLTYASRNLSPDFGDVYFRRSVDDGLTFSAQVAINSSPGSDRCQFFPSVAADETDGSVSVIWYDQRVGTDTSDLTELVHTHSADGGVTWSCPAALSDRAFHAEAGNRTSQPNIGDYIQCVSQGGTLYSVFAKTDLQSWLTFAPDTYVDTSVGAGEGPAPLGFVGYTFADSLCTSNNGYIEPGETISLTATIGNVGGCGGIGNVFATLTTTTPGITITTASATFPGMASLGSTSSNSTPFVFTVDAGVACGTKIDLTIDYVTDFFGPGSLPFEGTVFVGHPVETVLLSESFDGVVAPALPAGWTSTLLAGTSNPWRTSTTFAASASNSVFCADIATTSHNELQSPALVIPAGTEVVRVELDETHNNEIDTERRAWDGALMRILLGGTRYFNGGAGNMMPFYPWQMNRSTSTSNPLHDLACWSDDTTPDFDHYSTDFQDLGGQTINLVFGMSTDPSVGTATGQFIDNVVVTLVDYECDCDDPTPAGPLPLAFDRVTVVPNPFNPEASIRFTLPARSHVTAEVYSVSGAHVRTLAREGSFGPGTTELRWNGADDAGVSVASGVYFVRVRTAFGEHVARAVLLK
jgi:hypothetical protein